MIFSKKQKVKVFIEAVNPKIEVSNYMHFSNYRITKIEKAQTLKAKQLNIQTELLLVSAAVVLAVSVIGWRLRRTYDVLALGRDAAINLGIAYRKVLMLTLILIAVLVSVSTALVGPVTFFGLLVSNLAYIIMKSDKHAYTVPAAILLAIAFLVGGQSILERVLQFNTPVSVVIEFIGGLMFIFLVARKVAKQ